MARKQFIQACPSCGNEFCTEDKRQLHCSHSCANRKRARASISDRFWAKVRIGAPSECWPWIGTKDSSGYGRFRVNGTLDGAHRVSWMLSNGDLPEGNGHHDTCVLHRCDVRNCCNPGHLFTGSNADNVLDKISKGRLVTKLSSAEAREILVSSEKHCDLARRYGVSASTVSMIKSGTNWAHLQTGEHAQ